MAERTTMKYSLGVEVEIEPEKSITGVADKHDYYAHIFIKTLLSNEDVTRKFFLRYPEIARVQYYVDDIIRMDLRRPDDVEEETRKTLATIGEKLYGFETSASAVKVKAEKKKEIPPIPPGVRDELDDDVEIYGNAFALFSRGEWRRLDPKKVKLDSRGGGEFRDGGTITVPFEIKAKVTTSHVRCPTCKGTGRTPGVGFATFGEDSCPDCNGIGNIPKEGSDDGPTDGSVSSSPSIAEYPREIVCEACGDVVAFGLPNVQRGSMIIAAEIVRPDGSHPEQHDHVCLNCTGGGPFTVRDRPRTCLHCGGAGVETGFPDDDAPNPPPCPCCKGTGFIPA